MMKMNVQRLKENFLRFNLHFVLFWLLFYIGLVLMQSFYGRFWFSAVLVFSFFLITVSYSYWVVYFLMPGFLYKKKYFLFALILGLTILVIAVANSYSSYFIVVVMLEPNPSLRVWNLMFGSLLTTVLTVASFTSFKLASDYLRSRWINEKIEKEKLGAELQYLKAQIHPHFLFNTLNNLYFLIKKDPDSAAEMLLKLSDIMRYQLYETNTEKVTLEQEMKNILNYIELEKIRRDENLKIRLSLPEKMNVLSLSPYILFPFVENAFKHVSNFENKPNEIEICLTNEDGIINFYVKNSKESAAEQNSKESGIGIRNVKRRLELLYPGRFELEINNKEDFHEVKLKLIANEN